jgi:hypothetical protein
MNEYVYNYFSFTTAEDQSNYFTGEVKCVSNGELSEDSPLHPGEYRIIDGNLVKIKNGLTKDEVRSILKSRE